MHWRKSSFSSTNGACVEIAAESDTTYVRNSNHPDRGIVALSTSAVAAFVTACQAGEYDDLA